MALRIKSLVKKHPWMLGGIIAVMLMYMGLAGLVSTTVPYNQRGDTAEHVEYAWRLYHGDIPKINDGITNPYLKKLKSQTRLVRTSNNPPLYYAIHAPFVGPLLDGGHWQAAIAVGRAVNIVLGLVCIAVLAWAGWTFGGRRKELFAVAVPAIGAMMYRFVTLNVNYALDALLVTFTTLALINIYKLLKHGPKPKYLISIAAVSVLGMLTKAPYIVFLFVSLLGIVASYYLHGDAKLKQRIKKGSLAAGAVLALVIITTGWFYYFWNYKTSGSWFRSTPDDYTGGRAYKSLASLLVGSKLWSLFYADYAKDVLVSVAMLSFSVAGFLTVKKQDFTKLLKDKAMSISLGLMALAVLGTFLTQLTHAVGYGAVNFRYLLPAILPISMFICFGLMQLKTAKNQLISVFSLTMGTLTLLALVPSLSAAGAILKLKAIGTLNDKATANGFSSAINYVLLVSFVLGCVLLVLSLYKLSVTGQNRFKKTS